MILSIALSRICEASKYISSSALVLNTTYKKTVGSKKLRQTAIFWKDTQYVQVQLQEQVTNFTSIKVSKVVAEELRYSYTILNFSEDLLHL